MLSIYLLETFLASLPADKYISFDDVFKEREFERWQSVIAKIVEAYTDDGWICKLDVPIFQSMLLKTSVDLFQRFAFAASSDASLSSASSSSAS